MSELRPRITLPIALLALGCLGLGACAASGHRGAGGVESNGGGTVISGVALLDGQGSVLDAMQGKVPSMKIQRFRGQCPRIAFRNDATFRTAAVVPHVYVDGTRATDTCILDQLRSRDVERVEVYPSGVSNRPGYPSHAHGLILLFMRS